MSFCCLIQRPPLSRHVDFIWLAEGYAQPHSAERVLPTGCVELILSLDEHRGADLVVGARSHSIVIDTSKPLSFIGVRFRPGGAFPFLGLPVGELEGLGLDPQLLWGPAARALREQLLASAMPEARVAILERFLLERLNESRTPHPAVRYAIDVMGRSERATPIAAIVDRSGLSARRFIARFREEVGIAPKAFCRLARFRRAIGALGDTRTVDWSGIALDCGYFDQAHFIHDFRAFAGVSPSAYLRDRTTSANHIRIGQQGG